MRMARKFVLFTSAIFLSCLFAFSEEKKDKTPPPPLQYDVVVTATRMETPSKEIASSITVISAQDLKNSKKNTVLEILEEVLGVSTLQNGGKGGAASVSLRGANSEHTLILLDGVELNDPMTPSRSYDLAHLSLENIERVEILRGPQSTLYGSDAIGGVVNIITKKGKGRPKLSLSTSGGSYGTGAGTAGLSGSGDKVNYSLGFSCFYTRGISAASTAYEGNHERDGYRNLSFSGRLGFVPRQNLEVDFIVHSVWAKTDLDNFGGAFGDDPNNTQDYKSFFVKGQMRALLFRNRWDQRLGIALVDSNRHYENPEDPVHTFDREKGDFRGQLFRMDWQNNFFLAATNTLSFGIDYEREQGKSEYYSWSAWGLFVSAFPRQQANSIGFYLQDQIRLQDQFFATAGVRLDQHSQSGQALTYRLAPAYFLKKTGTKLKATLGTGFKSPSLYQLYAPPTAWGSIGNRNLLPERGIGWDFGLEQPFVQGKLLLGATYFFNTYRNLINFESLQGYVNIGNAESKGLELSLELKPSKEFLLRAFYTKLEAKDKDKNLPLLRRPKDKFTVNLHSIFQKKWNLDLSLVSVGKRDDLDFTTWPSSHVTLAPHTLLNASLSFDLNSSFQVFAKLENILDEKYEMVYGYGTPGFSVYGGFKLGY